MKKCNVYRRQFLGRRGDVSSLGGRLHQQEGRAQRAAADGSRAAQRDAVTVVAEPHAVELVRAETEQHLEYLTTTPYIIHSGLRALTHLPQPAVLL